MAYRQVELKRLPPTRIRWGVHTLGVPERDQWGATEIDTTADKHLHWGIMESRVVSCSPLGETWVKKHKKWGFEKIGFWGGGEREVIQEVFGVFVDSFGSHNLQLEESIQLPHRYTSPPIPWFVRPTDLEMRVAKLEGLLLCSPL